MEQLNCDYTKYPKIYSHTYWGNFSKTADEVDDELIDNRNTFIEKYNITSYASKIPNYVSNEMDINNKSEFPHIDHTECYKNKAGNYVLVVSPYYGKSTQADILKSAKENGWKITDRMYLKGAFTFTKIIQSKGNQRKQNRLVRFLKRVQGKQFNSNEEWETFKRDELSDNKDFTLASYNLEEDENTGIITMTDLLLQMN